MSKRNTIIALVVLTLVGSLMTALASNMLFSDIANIASTPVFLVSLPPTALGVFLVSAVLYVLRLYQRPKTFKKLSKHYLIVTASCGFVCFLTALLSGVVVYGNLLSPYPFKGFVLIFMILGFLLCAAALCGLLVFLKKAPEDEETFKVNAKHVFKTIGWFLFICLTFNRFGMLLGAPSYIYLRNLYMTFPFYLLLLAPLFLGTVKVLRMLEVIKDNKLNLILSIAALAFAVVLELVVIVIGASDSALISAVSPAMPLERLASMPVETIIHFLSYTAVGVILLLQALKARKQA